MRIFRPPEYMISGSPDPRTVRRLRCNISPRSGLGFLLAIGEQKILLGKGVMSEQPPKLPAELVLDKLRQKVINDSSLSEAIKIAFLADLDTEKIATFVNLKAVLAGKGPTDEAGSSESA